MRPIGADRSSQWSDRSLNKAPGDFDSARCPLRATEAQEPGARWSNQCVPLFRRFPEKPGRPGGKRLLGRRTSISGPATTERGSLRAHLAELVAGPSIAALYPPRVGLPCAILPRPRERQAAGWLLHCPLRVGGREIKICSAPLSEQHSSAGLDAAAQRRKKGRKCLFRRFPGKPGRPGGKRLLGRRTSIYLRTRPPPQSEARCALT